MFLKNIDTVAKNLQFNSSSLEAPSEQAKEYSKLNNIEDIKQA